MESIYRKHMAIKLGIYLLSAQLMGGGVLLWLSYIGVSLNTHRLGVINLPLCLKGAYWGGLAAVWKIDRWKCVGKGHGWIRREMEWLRGLWNGTTEPPMLCGAEVGEMNWTQCSEGWTRSEVRTATPETKWEERMNLPQAHGNKTPTIFWYCNN